MVNINISTQMYYIIPVFVITVNEFYFPHNYHPFSLFLPISNQQNPGVTLGVVIEVSPEILRGHELSRVEPKPSHVQSMYSALLAIYSVPPSFLPSLKTFLNTNQKK